MTPEEVAERYQVTKTTLYQWRRLGRGPKYVKLSSSKCGRVRYTLRDLEEWEFVNLHQNIQIF